MSTVVPFRKPQPARSRAASDAAAVASDLLDVLDRLEGLLERAAAMDRPTIEVERSVQHLLDAIGAVERASDTIGEGGGPESA